MRKAAIRDGDPTTTGGSVVGTSSIKDHGKRLALDGDVATCGNCEGTYEIFGTGNGIREKGRPVVVDGDWVLCPCGKNRVLVGSKTGYFINADADVTGARSAAPASGTAPAMFRSIETYTDRFILRNASGALAHTAYAVQRKDGTFEYGETDDNGCTHLLVSTASVEHVNVYFAG